MGSAAKAEEDSQSEKHQAELAPYFKLVPTTSAVPRNPGRSLRGGGLRSTGSVAAQKQLSAASVASHTSQKLTTIGRKEPLTSRMRNLFSDTSKPQLARRVATKVVAPLRATPATPPALPSFLVRGSRVRMQIRRIVMRKRGVSANPPYRIERMKM